MYLRRTLGEPGAGINWGRATRRREAPPPEAPHPDRPELPPNGTAPRIVGTLPARLFNTDAMDSLKGQLLISGGSLFDPNFRHTVVLIGEHNAEGALGVVLNRALDLTVEEAVPGLSELAGAGARLFEGGPVRPTSPVLLAEFVHPELADIPVFGSVGFLVGEISGDVRPGIVRARVFVGYAGWGPGQLEREMAEDAWILEPARVEDVFTDAPDLLWSRVLRRKGPEYERLSRVPFDPTMN